MKDRIGLLHFLDLVFFLIKVITTGVVATTFVNDAISNIVFLFTIFESSE